MAEYKILVVDDEKKLVEVIKAYLEKEGFTVYIAYNGNEAMRTFEKCEPSLIILDLMMPGISGEDLCRMIRKKSSVPIIMLTAKVEEDDLVMGLNIGADDYVTKPFSPRELVGRVRAVLRRYIGKEGLVADNVSFNGGDLNIDYIKYEVKKGRNLVSLTPNEYKILAALSKNPGRVYTRLDLVDIALGFDYEGFDRTIDTHIKNLRQKIEDNPKIPGYILTVYGIGYKFGGV